MGIDTPRKDINRGLNNPKAELLLTIRGWLRALPHKWDNIPEWIDEDREHFISEINKVLGVDK